MDHRRTRDILIMNHAYVLVQVWRRLKKNSWRHLLKLHLDGLQAMKRRRLGQAIMHERIEKHLHV